MNERIRLGITAAMIDRTEKNVLACTDTSELDDIAHFTRGVARRMRSEQPELCAWLDLTSMGALSRTGALTFAYATALAYDMIPEGARKEPITTEEIGAVDRSVRESVVAGERGVAEASLNLGWVIERLGVDSPDFIGWLGDAVRGLEDPADKKDFFLGVVLAVLPFYSRADSRILEQDLFGGEAKES